MWIVMCDENGKRTLGSDGIVWVKRGKGALQTAKEYRDRFKANFPTKWEAWSHFGKVWDFHSIPTESFPKSQITKIA